MHRSSSLLSLLILLILSTSAFSQLTATSIGEVKWLRSATEAARQAKATGKPILVYVRSENCHYCDLLQKNTWQDPEILAMITRDMIPLKLTLEENKEAIVAMKVKGFPATILFTADREYIARIDGYVSPLEFQSRITKARHSLADRTESELKR